MIWKQSHHIDHAVSDFKYYLFEKIRAPNDHRTFAFMQKTRKTIFSQFQTWPIYHKSITIMNFGRLKGIQALKGFNSLTYVQVYTAYSSYASLCLTHHDAKEERSRVKRRGTIDISEFDNNNIKAIQR